MSTEYEQQLLARARQLTDLSDITAAVLECLGGGRHAGVDPEAITGLVGCAAALGASSTDTYDAGAGWGGRHADERAFLSHVASIEDDIDERLAAAARLGQEVSAARDTARADLDGARGQLAAGIDGAEEVVAECELRVSLCETAGRVLEALRPRLIRARARIRAVPTDLGEVYVAVYRLIRAGGWMPREGRWITGESPRRRAGLSPPAGLAGQDKPRRITG